MSKVEQQPSVNGIGGSGMTSFSSGELKELSFRAQNRIKGYRAIVVPLRQVNADPTLGRTLSELCEQRGMTQTIERPRGGFPDSGNVVLRRATDDGLGQKVEGVDEGTLKSVLNFSQEMAGMVHQVDVLPNASHDSKKLNGVRVQFNPKTDWLKKIDIKRIGALGRGLMITALPRNFDEEWLVMNDRAILEQMLKFGTSFSPEAQRIKFIQLLYGSEGELYLALAAGPSLMEREILSGEAAYMRTQKGGLGALEKTLQINQEVQVEQRRRLSKQILASLGIGSSVDELVNVPYIWMNGEESTFCSGGVDAKGGEVVPYTVGMQSIIFHTPTTFVAIGTGAGSVEGEDSILLPEGISKENLCIPNKKVRAEIPSVKDDAVNVIAEGFHSDWKIR